MARPRPRLAPVTAATLAARCWVIFVFLPLPLFHKLFVQGSLTCFGFPPGTIPPPKGADRRTGRASPRSHGSRCTSTESERRLLGAIVWTRRLRSEERRVG